MIRRFFFFFLGFTMCKTGKKIIKINFNKFIWFYWKMKKKRIFYFFFGFLVAGIRKKMM